MWKCLMSVCRNWMSLLAWSCKIATALPIAWTWSRPHEHSTARPKKRNEFPLCKSTQAEIMVPCPNGCLLVRDISYHSMF
jgi:hypothetical protein